MINDILDAVRKIPSIKALLYADDLLLWVTSGSIAALEIYLNEAIVVGNHQLNNSEPHENNFPTLHIIHQSITHIPDLQ